MGSICSNLTITIFGVFVNFRCSHPSPACRTQPSGPPQEDEAAVETENEYWQLFFIRQNRDAIKQGSDKSDNSRQRDSSTTDLSAEHICIFKWVLDADEGMTPLSKVLMKKMLPQSRGRSERRFMCGLAVIKVHRLSPKCKCAANSLASSHFRKFPFKKTWHPEI